MITLEITTIDENPNFSPQNSQDIVYVKYIGNIGINVDCTNKYDHSKSGIEIKNIISDIGEYSDQHGGYVNSKKHQLNINVTYINLNMFTDNFTFEPPVVTLPTINSIALRYNINIQFEYTDQFLNIYGFNPTYTQILDGIYNLLTYHLPDEELPQGWDIPGISQEKMAYRRDKKINISKLLNLNTSITNQIDQSDQYYHDTVTVLAINFVYNWLIHGYERSIYVGLSNHDPNSPFLLPETTCVNEFELYINSGAFTEGRVPYCFDMDENWNFTYNLAGDISESIYKQWQYAEQLQNDIKNYAKYSKSSTNHTKFTIDLSNYENTQVSYSVWLVSKDNINDKEYGIAVDWGDGVKQPFISDNTSITLSHIYRQGGIYTIDIIGDIDKIQGINDGGFLTEILVLPMTLKSFSCCGYSNLVTFSADIPSGITNYTSFFSDCISLSNISEKIFTIPNTVSGCAEMFYNCLSLETIPAIKLPDTITNASSMFQKCQHLQTLNLEFSDSCENISNICNSCTSLQSVTINKLPDVDNLNCQFAFAHCTSLYDIKINTSKLSMASNVNYQSMFYNCYTLYDINFISEQNPLPSAAANYTRMFYNCTALAISCTRLFENWTDSLNIDVTEMFAYCYNIQGYLYGYLEENGEYSILPSPLITNMYIQGVNTMFTASSETKILQDQTNLQLLQQNGYYTQI